MDESTSRGRPARTPDFWLTNEYAAEQDTARQALERIAKRATPELLSVLSRYPATSPGTIRVAELVHFLDTALRAQRCPEPDRR